MRRRNKRCSGNGAEVKDATEKGAVARGAMGMCAAARGAVTRGEIARDAMARGIPYRARDAVIRGVHVSEEVNVNEYRVKSMLN